MSRIVLFICLLISINKLFAQTGSLSGTVTSNGSPIPYTTVYLVKANFGAITDQKGYYSISNIPFGSYTLQCSNVEFEKVTTTVTFNQIDNDVTKNFSLVPQSLNLDAVVVTGVSNATKLKNSPIPINTVSQKQIKSTISANVIDAIAKNTPGLAVLKTGPNISKPFIRGLGYTNVLTLFDGLRQEEQQWGDEHGLNIDDYLIKRAEVVKGPASLMYGSGAIGGVLNLIPFSPTVKDSVLHFNIVTEYHSNNNLIGASLRLQKFSKQLFYGLTLSNRIAGNYQNRIDGYVYLTGFRTTSLSGLIGKVYKKGEFSINTTFYNNLQGIPDGSRDSTSRKFTKQIYDGELDDLASRPIVPHSELSSYKLSALHQRVQLVRVFAKNDYSIGTGNLNTLIGFQQNIRREYIHPSTPQQAGSYLKLNTINYSISYNVPSQKEVSFSIGGNGMIQQNKNEDATAFPIPNYTSFDNGAYVTASLKKNRLNIYSGIRFDTRLIKGEDLYTERDAQSGFEKEVNPPTANSTHLYRKFEKTFSGVSGNFGMTYEVSKFLTVKANIGRGYRAPSINEIGSNGLNPGAHIYYIGNEDFSPEFNLQMDAEILVNYKNKITSSISLFNNSITNYTYLIQAIDDNGNPVVIVPNNSTYKFVQSKAQIFGFEGSLNFTPSKTYGLKIQNQFSLIYGYNRDKEYKNEGSNGEYLPFITPAHLTSDIIKTFKGTVGKLYGFSTSFGLSLYGNQTRFRADTETATRGYTLVNAGLNFSIDVNETSAFTIFIRANNLLDTAWQSNMNRLKYFEDYEQSPNGYLGIYDMGRNLTFKVIFQF